MRTSYNSTARSTCLAGCTACCASPSPTSSRCIALLAERSEIEDKPDATALKPGPGRIAFHNVSFAYDERRPILTDVSFEIPAGKTVAVVGPTGGGKTTIARLLFRFYDPQSGAITIDGQDLRDVTQDSLRHAIGVVPQDTVLFNDSIRYNIAYGDVEAGPAKVEDAARARSSPTSSRSSPTATSRAWASAGSSSRAARSSASRLRGCC